VIKSDPEFTYQTNYTSPNNYFTVTAKPVAPYNTTAGVGDFWIIEQLDASGNLIPGTNTILGINPNPNCWWGYPAANTFKGFDGTQSTGINNVTCPNPSPGKFANGGTYRITHGIWNDFCPWSQASHTITVIGNRVVEDPTRNANVPDFSHLKPSSKKQ
jgi:hypothetical protein